MPEVVWKIAMAIGLVPLAWCAELRRRGHAVGPVWWGHAAAFSVSFVADVLSLWWGHPLVQQTYPVLQAGLFAVLLGTTAQQARWAIGAIVAAAGLSIGLRQGEGLDVLLRVVAWSTVIWLAWRNMPRGWLRSALVGGFALMLWGWLAFVAHPGWWTYGAMQGARAVAALWWCMAAWQATQPRTT